MRLQVLQVEPVEQPAELLVIERDDAAWQMKWPLETLFFEPL